MEPASDPQAVAPAASQKPDHAVINDLNDTFALDAPVLDQCRRQCFDGWPMRQQQRQCPFSEALLVVAAACQPVQIKHGCGLLQVSVDAAVGLRERQYLTAAPLAAMDRLADATGKLDDDLRASIRVRKRGAMRCSGHPVE